MERTRRVGFTADGGPTYRVRKEGYLHKQVDETVKGGRLQRGLGLHQRRRYYMLTEASLLYFLRPPPDLALLPRAEGNLPLAFIESCSVEDGRANITIQVPDKRFRLRAASPEEAGAWVEAIEHARQSAPQAPCPPDGVPPEPPAGRDEVAVDVTRPSDVLSIPEDDGISPKVRASGRFLRSRRPTARRPSVEALPGAVVPWWKTSGHAPRQEEHRTDCTLCRKAFTALRWRFFCAICGRPHCDRCSSHAIMKKRVCSTCFVAAVQAGAADDPVAVAATAEACEAEEERNGPLGKYAKMEGVGVPLHGIFQAMKRDDVALDLALAFAKRRGEAGTSAYNAIFSNESGESADSAGAGAGHGRDARPAKHVKRKTQPFYWTALPKAGDDVSDGGLSPRRAGQRSLWDRSDEDALAGRRKVTVLQHEQIELETLFRLRTKAPAGGAGKGPKKDGPVTLVDSKRSQNVQIALRRFKCGHRELLYSIVAVPLDKDVGGHALGMPRELTVLDLSLSQLQVLSVCMPLPEEGNLLSRYTGDVTRLRPSEKWLKMASDAERASEKLHVAIWWCSFAEQCSRAGERCLVVAHAAAQVVRSNRLARVLEVVLAVGNALNQHTRLGNADGFDINTLLTLSHTRAVDNRTSLLRYIVRMLRARGEHELLDLSEDMPDLEEASRLEESACAADVNFLVDKIRRCARELQRFERDEEAREEQTMARAEAEMREFLRQEADAEEKRQAEEDAAERAQTFLEEEVKAPDATPKALADAKRARAQAMARESDSAAVAARDEAEAASPGAPKPPPPAGPLGGMSRNMLISAIAQAGTQAALKRAKKQTAADAARKDPRRAASNSMFPSAEAKWAWRDRVSMFVSRATAQLEDLQQVKAAMQENSERLAEYVCENHTAEAQPRILRTLLAFASAVAEANKLEERRDEHLQEQFESTGDLDTIGMSSVCVGQRVLTLYGAGIVEAKLKPSCVVVWLEWGRAFLQPEAVAHVGCIIEVPPFGEATVTHVRSRDDFILEAVLHASPHAGAMEAVVFVHPDRVRMVARRPLQEVELDDDEEVLEPLETPSLQRCGTEQLILSQELAASSPEPSLPLMDASPASPDADLSFLTALTFAVSLDPDASPTPSAASAQTGSAMPGSPLSAFSLGTNSRPRRELTIEEIAMASILAAQEVEKEQEQQAAEEDAELPEGLEFTVVQRKPLRRSRKLKKNKKTAKKGRKEAKTPKLVPVLSVDLTELDAAAEAVVSPPLSDASHRRRLKARRLPFRRGDGGDGRRVHAKSPVAPQSAKPRARRSTMAGWSHIGSVGRSGRSTGRDELYEIVQRQISIVSENGTPAGLGPRSLGDAWSSPMRKRKHRPAFMSDMRRRRHTMGGKGEKAAKAPVFLLPRGPTSPAKDGLIKPPIDILPGPWSSPSRPAPLAEQVTSLEGPLSAPSGGRSKTKPPMPRFLSRESMDSQQSPTTSTSLTPRFLQQKSVASPGPSPSRASSLLARLMPLPLLSHESSEGDGDAAPTFDVDLDAASDASGEATLPREQPPSLSQRVASAARSLGEQVNSFVSNTVPRIVEEDGDEDAEDQERSSRAAEKASPCETDEHDVKEATAAERRLRARKLMRPEKLDPGRSVRGFRVTLAAAERWNEELEVAEEEAKTWEDAWDEEGPAKLHI